MFAFSAAEVVAWKGRPKSGRLEGDEHSFPLEGSPTQVRLIQSLPKYFLSFTKCEDLSLRHTLTLGPSETLGYVQWKLLSAKSSIQTNDVSLSQRNIESYAHHSRADLNQIAEHLKLVVTLEVAITSHSTSEKNFTKENIETIKLQKNA